MSDILYNKYRPRDLSEVIGQDAAVASIAELLVNKTARTFLFVGPSGTGKTTLARIVASEVGCAPGDVLEIDAASKSGADDMRQVTESLRYRPFGNGAKMVIVDEVQSLSKQAWQTLLKSLEEPPEWVYWALCTTDESKVPDTVDTRAARFETKAVPWQTILDYILAPVAEAEGFAMDAKIMGMCARYAQGSPRKALVNLAMCVGQTDENSASVLLRGEALSGAAVDLARALNKGVQWPEALKILQSLKDENPETIRQTVRGYMTAVIMSTKPDNVRASHTAMAVLEQFAGPFHSADGITPVLLAVGRLLLT